MPFPPEAAQVDDFAASDHPGAGRLGVVPLAAYSVGYSLEPVFFMLALGISTAISNSVGSLLGASQVAEARASTATGLGVGVATVGAYVVGAFCARDGLVGLFSRDAAVLAAAAATWAPWCAFMLVSGVFALLLGLVKGLGLQRQMACLVVGVLWPVGAAGWSKWPSWRGHSGPPRAHQPAAEGFGRPSALVRRPPPPL